MPLTQAERAGLLIGSAGLFAISMTGIVGMLVLAYQRKDIPVAIGVIVGAAITGGIDALRKIGQDQKNDASAG